MARSDSSDVRQRRLEALVVAVSIMVAVAASGAEATEGVDSPSVSLSTPHPTVGRPVRASLTDAGDGASDQAWRWSRSENASAAPALWAAIVGAEDAGYTPTAADEGWFLRATASYQDDGGLQRQVAATTPHAVADRPNVVLIMADDIGYESFGAYGSTQYRTPRIDALAAEGVRFTNAYSRPLCTPSRVALMTGRSNARNYVDWSALPAGEYTIADLFGDAGYATAIAGKWQLHGVERFKGVAAADAGFSKYCLFRTALTGNRRYWNPSVDCDGQLQPGGAGVYGPDVFTDFMLDFIEANRETPFFAYYAMVAPHQPLNRSPPVAQCADESDEQCNFEDMVADLDRNVGRIQDKLATEGLLDRTILVFLSDNGTDPLFYSDLGGERIHGAKGTTLDAGSRVPLIVRVPDGGGRVLEDLVDITDILPTLADGTGLTLPEETVFDGLSFWDRLTGGAGNPRQWIYTYYFPQPYRDVFYLPLWHPETVYVRDKRYKLYGTGELYDTPADPNEVAALPPGDEGSRAARAKLQEVLDGMPSAGAGIRRAHVVGQAVDGELRPRWRPALAGARVAGAELTLTFAGRLVRANETPPSSFAVRVDGAAREVSAVAGGDTSVTLTLATGVEAGQSVTVSYTPGKSAIRHADREKGRKAVAFADVAVTNETEASDATLAGLALSGIDIGTFSPETTSYQASVDRSVATTTVQATSSDANAEVTITPSDADAVVVGHQVALVRGSNEISIEVTAADGEAVRTYVVTVVRVFPPLTASFEVLPELHSGVPFALRVRFSEPIATGYATMRDASFLVTYGQVTLANRVDRRSDLWNVVIEPTAAADIVVTLPAATDCSAAGAVCTGDGRGLSHSLVGTVTAGEDVRSPVVSVSAAAATGVEGDRIAFTVSRTGVRNVGKLAANLELTVTGGEERYRRHTVKLGNRREALLLLGLTDDRVVREAVTVTRTVLAGSGYRVSPDAGTAQTVLEDNDVPSFAVSAEPGGIEEGQSASVTVAITNAVTFAEEQTLGLAVSGVAASDYSLAPETLTLPAGSSSAAAILSASSDDLDESVETASVVASLAGASVGSATVVIADPLPVPGIAGVPQVGGSLEATFEEAVPADLRYQWLRGAGGEEISGAVGASYTAVEADEDEAVSVRVDLGNAAVAHTSAATAPVWPAASNPPLHGGDEELLGATMTLGSSDAFPLWLAGYGRFEGVAFGSMDRLSFSVGDVEHELTVAMVNALGGFALQASPRIADVSGLVVYWNDYRIESLAPDNDSDPEFWVASTPQPESEYGRYWLGASDGVQVALSIRRPMPEDDASLSGLTLSDVDIGTFDSEVTSYTAEVAFDVEMTTLEAVASDDRAVIEIADSVGSTVGPRRTSRLAGGANEITVTVTAADQETTRTYAVTVTRLPPPWGTRLRSRDISLSGASTATGVWSDGSTMWVVADRIEGVVQGYSLADGSRLAERDLELVGGYGYTTALWSDGSTLWAADYYGGVLGYRLSDGARLTDKDLDGAVLSAAGNDNPGGLWSDGTTLWVADHIDGWVYAYLLSDGSRVSAEEFSVRTSHHHGMSPFGLWFGDGTVLASYWARGLVMAYRESDGSHLGSREIDTGSSGNDLPRGLWSDGSTLWVADEVDLKLYAYAVPVSVAASQVSVESGPFGPIPPSWAPAVPSASPGPPVFVPDAGLRSRLEAALGKAPGESIGTREMAAIEMLNLDGSAPDLWALTGLAGLKRLSLRGNELEDLSALSLLAGLRVLDIGENRIVDLGPLAALTGLESLRADGNRIRDLAPLAGLPGLVRLDAGGNRIGDFSALEGNRRLRVLGTDEQEAPPPR